MSDHLARAQIVQLEVEKLMDEADRTTDLARLEAIADEMIVRLDSVREIRREQLEEQLDPPTKPKRRRWWRRDREAEV